MNAPSLPLTTAKLFRSGGSQAVRLPAEFRFDGSVVYIWRDEMAGTTVLSPRPCVRLADFLALRDALAGPDLAQYMRARVQPAAQQRAWPARPRTRAKNAS
jgi:antitoxin VapB